MPQPAMPEITPDREVHFRSAEHFCSVYEDFLAKGGLCVEGDILPPPLEDVEFHLKVPPPVDRAFRIQGQVVSVNGRVALVQFVSFGDSERTVLSRVHEAARASTHGERPVGKLPTCPQCRTAYDNPDAQFCPKDGQRLSMPETQPNREDGSPPPGTILGSYRVLDRIGSGGMGFVLKAEHTRLRRQVAIKMLRAEYASNPNLVKRFFGEALAVNQIKNEHIVEVTDFSEDGDGHTYYIMELLDGTTLKDALAASPVLPMERVLHIAVQVCETLAAVHRADIIHRDLKPENIFLTQRGGQADFVKILDFGVAKLMADQDEDAMVKTSAGVLLGTPDYMAPEQVMGKPVDHRVDVYAVGVILFEMLTGTKPVKAKNFGELVYRHMSEKPPAPAELSNLPHVIPPELNALVVQCLAKEPDGRPANMGQLAAELRKLANDGR